jgi:hypothetical protein
MRELEKQDAMAQAAAETLSQGIGTPLHHHAVSVQAKHDVADKSAGQTHPYRFEDDIDST